MPLPVRAFLMALFVAATLFGGAGRFDLPFFWAYVGLTLLVLLVFVRVLDPDLITERIHPGHGGVDRNLRLRAVPIWLSHLVLAGMDTGRFHWSGDLPTWLRASALVVFALGLALAAWAMTVNRFFSPVVRIQAERGHRLVTAGPYGCVRHPGYLASMFAFPAGCIALGSWVAIAALLPVAILVLRRTVIEDRYLKANLEGYDDYARSVRYRLVPGVW